MKLKQLTPAYPPCRMPGNLNLRSCAAHAAYLLAASAQLTAQAG